MAAKTDPKDRTDPAEGKRPRRRTPIWRRLLYAAAGAGLFLCLLEGVLWVCGVRPLHETDDPYVGFAAVNTLFEPGTDADGRAVLVTAKNKLRRFNPQQFPREKAAGTYRIFTLGGSTTFGRPYKDMTSFSGWLRELLPVADPTRKWEVVNAGGVSYASYRAARIAGELARYDPDLFIVYCGHNEFVEHRTYSHIAEMSPLLRETTALLGRSRTYSVMKHLIDGITGSPRGEARRRYELTGEVEEILNATSGPTSYTRDDALWDQILAHYRDSLRRIAETARSAGAEVIFIPPPSNLKDCSPFKSEHLAGLPPEARRRFEVLLRRGRDLAAAGREAEALARYRSAIAIDARHAGARFRAGRALLALKRFGEAKAELLAARDEDVCPLRAPSPMQRIVRQVAADSDAQIVDFARLLEEKSLKRHGHSILGNDDFLDHVHPNIHAHRLLAVALVDKLVDLRVFKPAPGWGIAAVGRVTAEVSARVDRRAHALALHHLASVLGWAGKHDRAARLGVEALKTVNRGPEALQTLLLVGRWLERQNKIEEAVEHYRLALQIAPNKSKAHLFCGEGLLQMGKLGEAETHCLEAVRLAPENPQTHHALGHVRLRQGRRPEAIACYTRAVELKPGDANNRFNLAVALRLDGQMDKAAEHFGQVVRLDPADPLAHNHLGRILAEKGRFDEAAGHFARAGRLRPDEPEFDRNLQAARRRDADYFRRK